MDDNTKFLRAILRQDWQSYDALTARFTAEGRGTPVAIIGAAFDLAVRRRFGPTTTMADVIEFVADTRVFMSNGEKLPPREAEALIAATLDMHASELEPIVDGLDVVSLAEVEGQLLFKLIFDEHLSDDQLDAFLTEAEHLVQEIQSQAQ